ncbi:Serine/threonine-protein kinase RAD53 [Seiridium cupressi]
MASQDESTQPATQNALDPRRLGQQNSGFSNEDIADIVCMLYPRTENASREVEGLADVFCPHIAGRYAADAIKTDPRREDDPREFGRARGVGNYAIVLRLSASVKSPALGFTFGRNDGRCDICFHNDPLRRLSNIHFRIYINDHGVLMLEDTSTNGTIVDDVMLKKKRDGRDGQPNQTRRTLESGTNIKILMHENAHDMEFIVRMPHREGALEVEYQKNLRAYFRKLGKELDLDRTIGPGPSGPVNLFPPPFRNEKSERNGSVTQAASEAPDFRHPQEFRGGERYNRVGVVGKGAFATVYKVTDKYTGTPYAAKELDKRKFMKNGVLDQKVENEMKIMQRVSHENIVQYIEHFDWDAHQFIIIMEYVPQGDLGKLVLDKGTITEPYVKIMARQLIDALGYLHDNKITHRDVKPDNILIQSTHPFVVKLTDFGLSKMIDTEQTFLKTFCGTLLYCAPEVYSEYGTYDDMGRRVRQRDRRPFNRERYDHAVDVWSLGGVLFYAMTGQPPFPVRNGTSYTELLHHIMTQPLVIAPLLEQNISTNGIDFLRRMIDRRPETRATIAELQSHPWLLSTSTESADEISDDGLEHGASQLSLYDKQQMQHESIGDIGSSALLEPEPDLTGMDFEDDKENYTFGQAAPNRLWGEVNNSAIGSSGAIGESRLNVSLPDDSFGETEILEHEILDSFESEDLSTPRQKRKSQNTYRLALSSDSTVNESTYSINQGIGSQSLGGDSAIIENLNMKSLARTNSALQSEMSDLNTSKRKPAYDTSDEYEGTSSNLKPSFKRLKSTDDSASDDEDDEYTLLAKVPPAVKSDSGRLIDYPVDKRTFWDAGDKQTWHLNYPEMTHSQYNAFKAAAEQRDEEFGAGRTPLWDVAMQWFPPTSDRSEPGAPLPEARPFLRRDDRPLGDNAEWDMPPTAPPPQPDEDDVSSPPDTLPPDSQVAPPLLVTSPSKTVVARLTSALGSLLKGISISITDPVASWGRSSDNTIVYQHMMESKVPKHAFRIVLWREGYTGSSSDFRPWDRGRSPANMRASPEPESYAFYLSTKATNGLRINNIPLLSHDPKNTKSPSKDWVKLYNGDTVVFWGLDNVNNQAKLSFECFWGGSSVLRPEGEPPTCIPEVTARKLDNTWSRGEKTLLHDRTKEEAINDWQYRMQHMAREQERSKKFELRRAEAARILALRNSRQASPMSAPPVMGRLLPRLRQGSPAAYPTQQ